MTDEYEDPTRELHAFIVVALVTVVSYLSTFVFSHPTPRQSASHVVVSSCVREKGAWPCYLALSADVRGRSGEGGQARSAATKALREDPLLTAFPALVPAPELLHGCGHTPACIIAMVDIGYSKTDIIEELER